MSEIIVLQDSKKPYVEAAREIHQRAVRERNPQAKELLLDIERSFQRLAHIERWLDQHEPHDRKHEPPNRTYDRPFVFFGLFRGE
jgi:hypothetical protein